MRTRMRGGVAIPFTPAEEAARDAEEAQVALDMVEKKRVEKYEAANAEYVQRGVIVTGVKVRGSTPAEALSAMAIKIGHRGNPNADDLADLHDKLDILKDLIETAVDEPALDAIIVIDDSHWV